ncbi:MAG: DUF4339 domain-containing protein [Akkermansiaceae bacterium]|nr:DUF4339 domain-containing protein [Akkermansiaceae bacterium]
MADWFYGKDNAQHGPVSDLEIRNLISTGQITQDTIIWKEGMTDWVPLKDVPDFQGGQQVPQAGTAANTSGTSPYSSPQTYAGQAPYSGSIPTDGMAIASMICGIIGVLSCYFGALLGIPAVICGHMSLKKINNSPTPIQGKGMAIAGLVTGYIGILMSLCVIVIFVFAIASSSPSSYSP